MVYLHTSDTTL
ncbi:unnamed protein product, partial [Cuscuta europaea]